MNSAQSLTPPAELVKNPFVRTRLTWLAYLMLGFFALLGSMIGPLMPFLRDELNFSYTEGGLHTSAMAVGMFLTGLTGERIAARLGRSLTLRLASLLVCVGVILLAVGPSAPFTMLGVLMMGFSGSNIQVMVQAILSDEHAGQRAIALAEANIGASLSSTLGPLMVAGFQSLGLGWRGALFFGVLIMAVLFVPMLKVRVPNPPALVSGAEQPGSPTRRGALPGIFWVYWAVILLSISIEWSMIIWGADFLEQVIGMPRLSAVNAITLFFAAAVIGRIAGSRLARRMPARQILIISLLITLFGFPIFWLARSPLLNVAGLFIASLGVASQFPMLVSLALGSAAPELSNKASARVSMGVGVSVLTAPLALGWIADQAGLQISYAVVPFMVLLALLVVLLVKNPTPMVNGDRNGSDPISVDSEGGAS